MGADDEARGYHMTPDEFRRWGGEVVEQADSYCFNPHEWMFTNFDCDCFWVADRGPLATAARHVRAAWERIVATADAIAAPDDAATAPPA